MIKRSPPSTGRPLGEEPLLRKQGWDVFWPGCDIDVDPFSLPARFEVRCEESGGDFADVAWDITISHDYVIRRRVSAAGNMVIEPYALTDFCALIIRAGYRKSGGIGISVNLVSEDLGIEIPVYAAGHSREAAFFWHAWSRSLGIPVRMLECDGDLRDPLTKDAAGDGKAVFERCRGRGLQDRRAASFARQVMSSHLRDASPTGSGIIAGAGELMTPPNVS